MASSQQQEAQQQQQPFALFRPDFTFATQSISSLVTSDFDNSDYGHNIISPNHGELAAAQGALLGPQAGAAIPNIGGGGLRSVRAH